MLAIADRYERETSIANPVAVLAPAPIATMEVRISGLLFPRAVLVTLALTTLTACDVGELPTDQSMTPDSMSSGGNGETSFNAQIKPIVGSCTGCHSGSTAPTLTSFGKLQTKYKMGPGGSNVLVTKGDHQGISYLNATQKTQVASWIDSL